MNNEDEVARLGESLDSVKSLGIELVELSRPAMRNPFDTVESYLSELEKTFLDHFKSVTLLLEYGSLVSCLVLIRTAMDAAAQICFIQTATETDRAVIEQTLPNHAKSELRRLKVKLSKKEIQEARNENVALNSFCLNVETLTEGVSDKRARQESKTLKIGELHRQIECRLKQKGQIANLSSLEPLYACLSSVVHASPIGNSYTVNLKSCPPTEWSAQHFMAAYTVLATALSCCANIASTRRIQSQSEIDQIKKAHILIHNFTSRSRDLND